MVMPIDLILGGLPDRTTKVNEDSPPAPKAVWWRAGRGERLWSAGEAGATWRVAEGLVGLWQPDDGVRDASARFVMLAYGGDLIGVEGQLFGRYAFEAVALTAVTLQAWSALSSQPELYWQHARRAHLVAQLRNGKARERLRRFLELIEAAAPKAPWPRLRDIAAITGLQLETVSRLLAPRARGTIIVSEEPTDHDRLCHLSG